MISVIFILIFAFLVTILRGFVLSQMWTWFIVPLGVPSINTVMAIGISFIVTLFITRLDLYRDKEHKGWDAVLASFWFTLTVWFFAYITSLFL